MSTAAATGGTGGLYNQSYNYYFSDGRMANGPAGTTYHYANAAHPHAVTSVGANTCGYDANGNMITRTVNSNTYLQSYDAENRLAGVTGAATASFVYDGDNNRVKGTVGSVTTVYVSNIYEVQGSAIKKYYYAGNQRVAMRDAGTLRWLLGDHLGSTTYIVSGTVESGETRYLPWGQNRYTSGTTPTSYKYTGQREEASLGLYYYGARWYDPALGRFIQPDTIVPNPGDAQNFDRYAYVLNNPLRYSDPTGHYSRDEVIQHFGCAENDWGCVEDLFANNSKDSRYRGAGEWLTILLDAFDGDVVTAWNPNYQAIMTGHFLRNAETGEIGIQMVTGNGQLTGPIHESAFAAYGAGKPYVGGYNYAMQRSKHVQTVGQVYHLPAGCDKWDCVAIGLDIAAIGGDLLRSSSLACAWAAPGCYMTGQATSVGTTVYGLARTELAHASGNASDADLAVNRATVIMSFRGKAPIFTSVGGLIQLAWDFLDPFHPW